MEFLHAELSIVEMDGVCAESGPGQGQRLILPAQHDLTRFFFDRRRVS